MSLLPIPVPKGYTIIVKEGEKVSADQVIARRSDHVLEKSIPLSDMLGVSPKKAAKYLKKSPGDSIKQGESIAAKPSFISVTEVVSSVSGTVLRFDRETGNLVIELQEKRESISADIIAPFEGVVRSVSETLIEIDGVKDGSTGVRGVGGKAEGLLFPAKSNSPVIDGTAIVVDMIGNIILGGTFSREALVKASGIGVGGIIALAVDDDDLAFLEEKRMLLPVLVVDNQTFQSLAKQIGKKVYLDTIAKTVLVS